MHTTKYRTALTTRDDLIISFCFCLLLTDLCSSEHLPEVEIFSLLEEQIPKYKIRADSLTQFAGYENQVCVMFLVINSSLSVSASVRCTRARAPPAIFGARGQRLSHTKTALSLTQYAQLTDLPKIETSNPKRNHILI